MRDDDIERVLKAAGQREKVPPEIERTVRENLREVWLAAVSDGRHPRRRRAGLAIAASIIVTVIGGWFLLSNPREAPVSVGTLAVATGEVRVRTGWIGGWRAIGESETLMTDQILVTGPGGRAAIRLPGGASARLDHDTRIRMAKPDRLVIERGALYVDAGRRAGTDVRLAVETPAGTVRHVGTQYEVRLLEAGVRLRVREGRIQWRSKTGSIADGRSGEQLVIGGAGEVARTTTPTYGESWDWIATATPGIDIDGLPLSAFLAWAGRELGREIAFESTATAGVAAEIVVHGSIAGLTPLQALDAVLATTRLRADLTDGRIGVRARESAAAD